VRVAVLNAAWTRRAVLAEMELPPRRSRFAARRCRWRAADADPCPVVWADVRLAGSLSLAMSLPTMIVGFTRYSRDQSFSVLGRNRTFLLVMAVGSIVGTFIGGRLLGLMPNGVLLPALAAILLISAWKVASQVKVLV